MLKASPFVLGLLVASLIANVTLFVFLYDWDKAPGVNLRSCNLYQ
jgi:hypothetical protein